MDEENEQVIGEAPIAEPIAQPEPAPINPEPVAIAQAPRENNYIRYNPWQERLAEERRIYEEVDLNYDYESERVRRAAEAQRQDINFREHLRRIFAGAGPMRVVNQPIAEARVAHPVQAAPAIPEVQPLNVQVFQEAARRILGRDFPEAAQPREPEPRRDMNYDQLVRRYSALTDRYLPDLSNRDNAVSALQAIDSDQSATDQEKSALREYIGAHTTASNYTYRWCADCTMMVGFESHSHCPHCTYPIVPAGDGVPKAHEVSACGFCGDCCRLGNTVGTGRPGAPHHYCPVCSSHQQTLCRHCSRCSTCCECILCPHAGCQEMQECEGCHNCVDHCSCVLAKTNGPFGKTFPAFKKTERKLFDCNRFAGIEWEYNQLLNGNRYIDHWCRRWMSDLHRDDSCGYEAVTAPVAGDYMVKCIEQLGKVFEKSRVRIDNRCSIHTHVDAKDLQWVDMFRFLAVYAKVEPILYLIAGQDRLSNRYALPIGKDYAAALDRTDRKDAIMSVAFTSMTREGRKSEVNLSPGYGKDAQKEKPGRRADNHAYCRRRGLNILPWLAGRGPRPRTPVNVPILNNDTLEKIAQRHGVSVAALMRWNKIKQGAKLVAGRSLVVNKRTIAPDTTVEFRIHPHTNDATRVINWAKLMVRLVDWAAKSTDKDLENLPKSPLRILCQNVAPELAPWIMSRVKEWRQETSRRNGGAQRLISLKGGKYVY